MLLLLFLSVAGASRWVIQLQGGAATVSPAQFARDHGFHYEGPVSFLDAADNFHVFTDDPSTAAARQRRREGGGVNASRRLRSLPEVRVAEEQVPRRHHKRVADPLYESQWHLHTHPYSVRVDAIGVTNATGRGVTIAIVDDGLQHSHPDLHANYDAAHSWDFNDNDADPTPVARGDGHGTSAAGVAAAVKENGHCGRGVAPQASLVGLRTIADSIDDLTEARALSHNGIGVVDIYSCSWGPADDGVTMIGPGTVVAHTLSTYAGQQMRGRLGKGTVYVWASGNGRDHHDTCSFDGYASSPYVIPIGAVSHEGRQAWYSEGCAALMGVTPSSGAMRGVTTVDLTGSAGYDAGECTTSFGGTSAAAPLASGIIALILQERPDLTWRDVKHIIAKGATPIDAGSNAPGVAQDWHTNTAGYRHSYRYGFGLLTVPSLLAIARTHRPVPVPFKVFRSGVTTLGTNNGGLGMIPYTVNYTIPTANAVGTISFMEHVMLYVAITHERRGNVRITLTSHATGTVSELAAERPGDATVNYPWGGWTFTSVRHWGEPLTPGSVWSIAVDDRSPRTRGRGHLNAFELIVHGY